jgi:hypothetical protein
MAHTSQNQSVFHEFSAAHTTRHVDRLDVDGDRRVPTTQHIPPGDRCDGHSAEDPSWLISVRMLTEIFGPSGQKSNSTATGVGRIGKRGIHSKAGGLIVTLIAYTKSDRYRFAPWRRNLG